MLYKDHESNGTESSRHLLPRINNQIELCIQSSYSAAELYHQLCEKTFVLFMFSLIELCENSEKEYHEVQPKNDLLQIKVFEYKHRLSCIICSRVKFEDD